MSGVGRILRLAPTLLRVSFSEAIAYRSEFVVWILSTNMPLIMLILWTAVAKDAPIGRFGQAEFSAYFLYTLVVRLLTTSWIVWELNYEIRRGILAMRLMRPIHPFFSYAAENLAAMPFYILLSSPVVITALLWLGPQYLSPEPLQWVLFPLSLIGAWLLSFSAGAVMGTLGLYWESTLSLFWLWMGLFFVFSGYTIPLELFPPRLLAVVLWLPFRFQLAFPVHTLLGLDTPEQTIVGLGIQWSYVSLFLGGALWLWKRGLKRYAAFGG